MANFDSARIKHISKAKELESILKFYSYSTEANAARTEETLKGLLVAKLRESKQHIMDLIQFVYQIQEDKAFDSILEPLRDEIDILGDEVKVSYVRWQELPERFWELVIAHDLTLVDSTTNLSELAEELGKLISGYKKAGNMKVFDRNSIGNDVSNMQSLLDGIRHAFKEREAILGLEESDLSQDFEAIRKRIEESI